MAADSWYVFIEEDTEEREWTGDSSFLQHRWQLVAGHHVDGGKRAAESKAEELADSHVPQCIARRLNPGGRPRRSVFRMHDGTWLVQVKYRYDELHFRVGIGELVRAEEEIKGKEPPEPPKRGFKTLFGR
ncbi:hypothetical protein [Streptomyces sp. NPDC046805]|uniref:hypothetical protein n=1 Tax=Streptomyces sp. NPDC046805 TaxID=3155134 RepID=UPI0033F9A59C